MVKKSNLNGKNQKKVNQERDQNHQNAKNVEPFGKDQNQNAHSVKLNYPNQILRNSINHQNQNQKQRKSLLQVVHLQKMKMIRKKFHQNQKNQNSKNQNAQVAKKNYHSSLENMDIDMDSWENSENMDMENALRKKKVKYYIEH